MYGGNGITTFALPNLKDRAEIGTGDAAQIAHVLGSNTFTLLSDNIRSGCTTSTATSTATSFGATTTGRSISGK